MTTKTKNDGRLASSDDAKPKTSDETKLIKLRALAASMEQATMRLLAVKGHLEATMEYTFPDGFDVDRWWKTCDHFESALRGYENAWNLWMKQASEGAEGWRD